VTDLLRPAVPVDFIECFATMCSTRIPVRALKDISSLESVQLLWSVQATTNIGSVTSEGDLAMFSNLVRTKYAVNGSGLLIGVMSDSYNCVGNAANDIASGDLPSGANRILVLADLSALECFGSDEGRAMMQLVYDVAPGASLAFRMACHGQVDFVAGILQLAAAGCNVIVDDIIYYVEPCSKMASLHRPWTKWWHRGFLSFPRQVMKRTSPLSLSLIKYTIGSVQIATDLPSLSCASACKVTAS
jgi:hypothetical protein